MAARLLTHWCRVVPAYLVAGILAQAATAAVPAATDDAEVLRAVIEHTIRPEIRAWGRNARIPGDPLLLILDRTSMVCESGHDRGRQVCVTPEELLRVRGQSELVQALVLRNRESEPVPLPENAGVVSVSFADLQQTLQQRSQETSGYAAFSLPGYSADGEHALVFGFHSCNGGRCQRGNVFLLAKMDGGWKVESVVGLWLS